MKQRVQRHPLYFFLILVLWIVNAKIVNAPQHVMIAHAVTASFRFLIEIKTNWIFYLDR